MKKTLMTTIIATAMFSGAAFAQAISTSTYRWTDSDGNLIREYTETKQYKSIEEAQFEAKVGAQLPANVTTTYELPATIKVEQPERYRYVMINGHPVIVGKEDRKIIHVFTP